MIIPMYFYLKIIHYSLNDIVGLFAHLYIVKNTLYCYFTNLVTSKRISRTN